jgi:Transposase DDE domain
MAAARGCFREVNDSGAIMRDIRLERRSEALVKRVAAMGSLVARTVGGGRSGEVAVSRFLGNPTVAPDGILAPAIARTRAAAKGERIVVAQDTTEINFAGREQRRQGLGPAGDGKSLGFFVHPQIAINAKSGAVLGLVGARIWTREALVPGASKPAKKPGRRARATEDKESQRWLDGVAAAVAELGGVAESIVVAGDRESDIYPLFATRVAKNQPADLVVRAAQDRTLVGGGSLKSADIDWPVLGTETVPVAARRIGATGQGKAAPARDAKVAIRAGTVTIRRPAGRKADPATPAEVTLGLVVVREIDPPPGLEPLLWRLVTTLPVATRPQAREVIRLYRMRWRIEETFRALKTDGLDLEASQVTTAPRLFNLAALGLLAAVRIIQLVDARDGSDRPATDVIEARAIPAVAAISRTLEGNTPRQKNRWPAGGLAWLSWVCARLGGWNIFGRPAGPKTMAAGWRRLAERLQGFDLASDIRHV